MSASPQGASLRLFSGVQAWGLAALALSLLICGGIALIQAAQVRSLEQISRTLDTLRLARVDLSKGFLYSTLGADPESPFSRSQGLALLDQGLSSMERSLAALDWEDASLVAAFNVEVKRFRTLLGQWREGHGSQRDLETRLRVVFHAMEQRAGQADVEIRRNLTRFQADFTRQFQATLVVSGLLLVGVFCGVVLAGRAQERSARALRQSEERWHFALEGAGDGIWDWNLDQESVFYSARWKRMLGYSEEEIGDSPEEWRERVHPEDLERVRRELGRHLDGLTSLYTSEHRLRRRDGSYAWVLDRGKVVDWAADGRPRRFIASQSDISGRKASEERAHWEAEADRALSELSAALIGDTAGFTEITEITLHYARLLTGSQHGFATVLDQDSGDNVSYSLTRMMDKECRIQGGNRRIVFPRPPDGVYPALWGHVLNTGQAFFTNEPAAHPAARGLPEGHIPLENFLSVPALVGGRLVGQVALANAPQPYTERDLDMIERLARLYSVAVERKHSLEALSASEERFRATFEQAAVGIALMGVGGRLLRVNQRLCDLVGRDGPDLLGMNVRDITLTEDQGREQALMEQTLSGATSSYSLEKRFVRRNGEHIWAFVSVAVVRRRSGEPDCLVVVAQDIDDRKRAEDGLRESEARFRSLFDGVESIAVQGYDGDLHAIYWNAASQRLYGYGPGEALGCRLEDLILPPEGSAQVLDEIRRLLATGEALPARELSMRRKDGTRVPVFSSHALRRGRSGSLELFRLDVDLTELTKVRDELLRAKEAAEAASKAKSEFLATMSHEIRTPLNGVLGMLQLAGATALDREQTEYVETATSSARSLLRILSDILDISRIESGRMPLGVEAFELAGVVQPVVSSFQYEAGLKGLEFQWEVAPDTPARLRGDAGRIRQVLYNLVGNAVKYTETGGVRLEIYPLQRAPGPGRVFLHIVVSDTGIGIPDDKLGTIFESFTQADGSYTRRFGGSGLGLSIVKHLVRLMSGSLAVVSEQGVGTEVHVTLALPLAELLAVPAAAPEAERSGEAKSYRILVAEDDRVNLLTIRGFLRKMGHSVDGAANGAEALTALERERYDCVFMDVQMPVMDGVTATKRIRASQGGAVDPALPIIAVTAHAMPSDRDLFLAAGMDGYLAKPVEMEELRRVLERVMARRG